jgi:hypothetical protein
MSRPTAPTNRRAFCPEPDALVAELLYLAADLRSTNRAASDIIRSAALELEEEKQRGRSTPAVGREHAGAALDILH